MLAAHKLEQLPRAFFLSRGRRNRVTPAADPTVSLLLISSDAGRQRRQCDRVVQVLTVLRQYFWKNPVAVNLHRNLALDEEIELAGRSAPLARLGRAFKSKFLLRTA